MKKFQCEKNWSTFVQWNFEAYWWRLRTLGDWDMEWVGQDVWGLLIGVGDRQAQSWDGPDYGLLGKPKNLHKTWPSFVRLIKPEYAVSPIQWLLYSRPCLLLHYSANPAGNYEGGTMSTWVKEKLPWKKKRGYSMTSYKYRWHFSVW